MGFLLLLGFPGTKRPTTITATATTTTDQLAMEVGPHLLTGNHAIRLLEF